MLLLLYILDWYAERSGILPDPWSGRQGRKMFIFVCLYGLAYALGMWVIIRMFALLLVYGR